jgi:uncharacterized protein
MLHTVGEHKGIEDTILRCQVGSGLHGVTLEGTDDRDLMSIVVEPPEVMLGLHTSSYQHTFEHDVKSWRPDGTLKPQSERSGAGYVDLTAYGLSKWASMVARSGNPTPMLPLWAPASECEILTSQGRFLRANARHFMSKRAGKAFQGYLQSQIKLMLGMRAGKKRIGHTNRPELIDEYGFDTKAGYHALRLGMQGIELMLEGELTLPIPAAQREFLLDVRAGVYSVDFVLATLEALDANLAKAIAASPLPDRVHEAAVNKVLVSIYRSWWLM